MVASRQDIKHWLKKAPKRATHMAVVCDTYDWEDYPVYVMEGEDPHERLATYKAGENMTKLMEVYNLSMDHEAQMKEHRAFNY